MKKKFKLGVIGAGFMATAILKGAINGGSLRSKQILVSDVNEESLSRINELGVKTIANNNFVLDNCEFVLFAVKPQNFAFVFENNRNYCCNKFISIMAGVNKEKIKVHFNNSLVARCMPNTPCSVGAGTVAIDLSDFNDKNDVEFIVKLFNSFSKVVLVDESKMNAVTGISGSAPAYFYLFVKSIIDAGVKNGLSFNDAKNLAVNTMIGSGKMLLKNDDKNIDELIQAVCSKGGTTIEAVNVFNDSKIDEIILNAVNACIKRAYELENL